MMTKEEKLQLKKKLPPKWVVKLSLITGLSKPYVMKVMAGKMSHLDIERAALNLAKEYKNEISKVEQLKEAIL